MKTKVVNMKREKEWSFHIARPSYWGNPFSEDPNSTADIIVSSKEEAIDNYKKWILGEDFLDFKQEQRNWIINNLKYIKGKKISCYCKVHKGEDCHGYVLAELADNDFDIDKISEHQKPKTSVVEYNTEKPKTKAKKLF